MKRTLAHTLSHTAARFFVWCWAVFVWCWLSQKPAFSQDIPIFARIERQAQEWAALEAQKVAGQQELARREAEHGKRVAQIERLKAEPPGPVRDLRLESLLAQAKEQGDELSQQALALQKRSDSIVTLQKQLLALCNRALATGESLTATQRVRVLQLLTALSEQLHGDVPNRVRDLSQKSEVLTEQPLQSDEPQWLRERADLLRDVADKLARETEKLAERRVALVSRQRIRQRAAAVDEDLFAEQATARRGTVAQTTREGASAKDAAPMAGGPSAPSPPAFDASSGSTVSPQVRSGVDPAALDALLRADVSKEGNAQAAVLLRAESELKQLAIRLRNRAAELEKQAQAASRQK